jgi:PiT family inorganic phosphate transporter
MLDSMAFVIFLVIVALVFDFLNGFHDSANSISTVVSTRVLSPKYAVIWAAFFNFAAVFFVGTAVAHTIGKGIIHLDIVDNLVILSALSGAIIWNIATWYYGLPSSSSHALIGGLIGAGIQSRNKHISLVGHYQNNCFYHRFPCYRHVARFYFHGSYHESEP